MDNIIYYGSHLFPFIEVDGIGDSFKQETIIFEEIGGKKIARSNWGFFGVGVSEEYGKKKEQREAALEDAFQDIAAFELVYIWLRDASTRPIIRTEVYKFRYDSDKEILNRIEHHVFGDRGDLTKDTWIRTTYSHFKKPLTNQEQYKFIENGFRLRNSPDWPILLRLHSAYGLYHNMSWSSAYLLGWSVIEEWLDSRFQALCDTRKVTGLVHPEDHRTWTASSIASALRLSGEIDDDIFLAVQGFRKKRNDIVHELKECNKTDAKEILEFWFKKCGPIYFKDHVVKTE
jgi:hypothetical protein